MSRSTTIGRNDLCPCGSGKKLKRCHLLIDRLGPTAAYVNSYPATGRKAFPIPDTQRQNQQGLGQPIVSLQASGGRFVAVRNKIYQSRSWKTFHDFLRDYVALTFGIDWIDLEKAKPENERHPVVRWALQAIEDFRLRQNKDRRISATSATAAMRAFIGLSYNLYLMEHNVTLQTRFVSRLKNARNFWGALYETYVAAAFIRAGFAINFEDESDSASSHCEFVAEDPITKRRFSVEAKAREPRITAAPGHAQGGIRRPRFGVVDKLHKALQKRADHPRVVFIELGLTPDTYAAVPSDLADLVRAEVQDRETALTIKGQPAPPAYVFVTNHPFHYRADAIALGPAVIAMGFKITNFGYNFTFSDFHDYEAAKEQHGPMFGLMKSIATHLDVPSTFDGDNPEYAFAESDTGRFTIGHQYIMPVDDGGEVVAELTDAIMVVEEKTIYGVFAGVDGKSFIATCPASDVDVKAYMRHPDTFFGIERKITKRVDDVVDLYEFLHETYRQTPRAKLLDFMRDAQDYEDLRRMSQEELAVEYCQRHAWAAEAQRQKK